MAALQPSAEGQGMSPTEKKSFSQLFTQPAVSTIQITQTSVYKGEAAVVFSKADADRLAAPFRWALVGKFSHGRPSLETIRKFFASLNLKDQASIGLMDYRHVLIKCNAEADFNRIWTRGVWQLSKYPMRVFRWTRDFHVHRESSLVPVWVTLPTLPIHYFDKHSLFSILSPVGRPMFLDSATAAGTRPSVARVCVEIDIAKIIVSRVWVAVEGESGFWQRIVPENMPTYCSSCLRLGHSQVECKKNLLDDGMRQHHQQQGLKLQGNNVQLSHLENVHKKAVVNESQDVRTTDMIHEGGTQQIAVEEVAGSHMMAEEGDKMVQNDDQLNPLLAEGDEGMKKKNPMKEDSGPIMIEEKDDASIPKHSFISKPSSIFAEGQVAAMGDETDNIAIQAFSHMEGSSHAHHGEQTIMDDQLDKQQANEKQGTHLPADNSFILENHHMAESNALDNIYVDLRGAEEDFVSTDNAVAGNLSPRLVVPPQQLLESSTDALNIDQSKRDDHEFRHMRGKGVRAR